jgi:hypothetical protein
MFDHFVKTVAAKAARETARDVAIRTTYEVLAVEYDKWLRSREWSPENRRKLEMLRDNAKRALAEYVKAHPIPL